MDEEKSFLPWIIFLSVLVLGGGIVVWLVGGSAPVDPQTGGPVGVVTHSLAGKWRNADFGSLIVYEDQWAAANGVKCRWEPAAGPAIRIELDPSMGLASLLPVAVLADFRLHPGSDGRQAVLNFLGTDLVFDREDGRAQTKDAPLP